MAAGTPFAIAPAMTAPRQLLPGKTYLITRACLEHRFFLKPSARVNAIFRYVLAATATRHGIRLHAFCAMSNHLHLVLTDPNGTLPAFERDLDSGVGRAVNFLLRRRDHFWASGSYNAVLLEDRAAVLDKIVYTLANPVAAGLVRRGREWPGVWSDPSLVGQPAQLLVRPRSFFREGGPTPAMAPLGVHLPPGFDSLAEFRAALEPMLRAAEDHAAAALGAAGRSFLGVVRVLAQSHLARPPPQDPRPHLRPRFATRDPSRRALAIARLRAFLLDYAEALEAWRTGRRGAVFPAGTYLMRVVHAAACAPCAPGG